MDVKAAEAERLKGNEHLLKKNYEQAVEAFTNALEIVQEASTYSNRAMAYLRLKKYPQVIEDANSALKYNPNFVKAFHRRGHAYLGLEKFDLAINDFQHILSIDPDQNPDVKKSLKEAQQKFEQFQSAKLKQVQDEVKQVEINKAEDGPKKMTKNQQIMQNDDYTKKDKQREDFERIKCQIESLKDQAAEKFKGQAFEDASKIYWVCAAQLDVLLDKFPLFKKEIAQMEANVFNNMAYCFNKLSDTDKEVDYCSLVIERALFLDEISVLTKAYLRRGLAYEQLHEYTKAVEDLVRVTELQPQNKQAQTGVQRCIKSIEQNDGVKYEINQPVVQPAETLPDLEGVKTAEQLLLETLERKEARKKARAPKPKVIEPLSPSQVELVKTEDEKLLKQKEKGNEQFKLKNFQGAIKNFSEGISEIDNQLDLSHPEIAQLKLKITQLYTNRCLCYHNLNQQELVIEDATYVLSKLDCKNVKALFRRAHAFKSQAKWSDALRDLDVLIQLEPTDSIKKDISECFTKYAEQKKQAAKEAEQRRQQEENKKSVQLKIDEQSSTDSDDEVVKPKKVVKKINQVTLDAAKMIAAKIEINEALNQVPKNGAGFLKDFNALRKDPSALMKYLKQLPLNTVESWFKNSEVEYDMLSGIISLARNFEQTDLEWLGKLLVQLSKAKNFDMTRMFLEDFDLKAIESICEKILSAEIKEQIIRNYLN